MIRYNFSSVMKLRKINSASEQINTYKANCSEVFSITSQSGNWLGSMEESLTIQKPANRLGTLSMEEIPNKAFV